MTVIAYRAGILAADTGLSVDDVFVGHINKIVVRETFMYACYGNSIDNHRFGKWSMGGFLECDTPAKLENAENFGAVVAHRNGLVEKFNGHFLRHPFPADCLVVDGCHRELMLGVMYAGLSPIDAVQTAIKYGFYAAGDCIAYNTKTATQICGPSL